MYGSAAAVATFAGAWTRGGEWFDADEVYDVLGTIPTLTQVEEWLDEVSIMMDLALANEGFIVPVVQPEVIKALGAKVSAFVADLANLSHSNGRLFSDRIQESGVDPMSIIDRDVSAWVKRKVAGLEAMGVPRVIQQGSQSAYSVPMGRQT
jgi:hypothetical protein